MKLRKSFPCSSKIEFDLFFHSFIISSGSVFISFYNNNNINNYYKNNNNNNNNFTCVLINVLNGLLIFGIEISEI